MVLKLLCRGVCSSDFKCSVKLPRVLMTRVYRYDNNIFCSCSSSLRLPHFNS